jgi:hypothetical protein
MASVAALVVVLLTGCGRSKPPCPEADLTLAEDRRTAESALAVAAEAADMAEVPTEVDTRSIDWEPGGLGATSVQLEQVSVRRTTYVPFAPLAPPVEALKGEGFEGPSVTGNDTSVVLERGQQRARVELGERLRDNPGEGQAAFTIEIWTGCRRQ